MGFDLYAIKPKTDKEQHSYFRASIWYWRPLWAFVEIVCCDEISKLEEGIGRYNDGQEIPDEIAMEIGNKLNKAIRNGIFRDFQDLHEEKQKNIEDSWYKCDIELTDSFVDFCLNSGGFSIC